MAQNLPNLRSLTVNGTNIGEYVITCPRDGGASAQYAARELQRYIALTAGVTLPVEAAPHVGESKRILIDDTLVPDDSTFRYFTDGDGLVIAGERERGVIYAVYHFLEKALGWRFFTSDTEACLAPSEIDLSDLDYTYVHPYQIRCLYAYDYRNRDICLKRYMNGDGKCGELHAFGGVVTYCPNGIHTFGRLSETGEGTDPNPCLNSPTVKETMLKNIRKFLSAHPGTRTVHVSQNDTDEHCTCPMCTADLERYGAPSGSVIKLMNYLAEELAADYPEVMLITFAYRYTLTCPDNIVCHDRVTVEIAPLDLCGNHAMTHHEECHAESNGIKRSGDTCRQIEKWKKICRHFAVYDYGTNFRYYYCPYPDFHVLWEDYRVFNSLGAWGYINLCNPHTPSPEFGDLRNYLSAKLIEEPRMTKADYERHIGEFLEAFYGGGWREIKAYFDLLHRLSAEKGQCFSVYSSPEVIFGAHAFASYSDELVRLFDRAEELAETETQRLHVKRLRISMDYLRIGAIHQREMTSGDESRKEAMLREVKNFHRRCPELGMVWITESCRLPQTVDERENPRAWVNFEHGYEE